MGYNLGLKSFIALIIIVFGLIMLGIAAWGYSILPSNCPQNKLRTALTTMICASVVLITVFIGYFICINYCYASEKSGRENINNFIWGIATVSGAIIGIAQGVAIAELNDSSNSVCLTSPSSGTYVRVMKYTLVIPIILTVYLVATGIMALKNRNEKASEIKSSYESMDVSDDSVQKAKASDQLAQELEESKKEIAKLKTAKENAEKREKALREYKGNEDDSHKPRKDRSRNSSAGYVQPKLVSQEEPESFLDSPEDRNEDVESVRSVTTQNSMTSSAGNSRDSRDSRDTRDSRDSEYSYDGI